MPEVFNLDGINASYDYEKLKQDPFLWQLNCLDGRDPPNDHAPFEWPIVVPALMPPEDPPVNSFMFTFTSQALVELKKLATPADSDAWISTNDALTAFLWRHTTRARFPWSVQGPADPRGSNADNSNVIIALDGRKELAIPPSYIGNVLFHCFIDLPIGYVGGEKMPLSEIALGIRKTINKVKNKVLLKEVVALAATMPDVRTIRWACENLDRYLYTTSWINLPFYRLSWGPLGKAEFFRIPTSSFIL